MNGMVGRSDGAYVFIDNYQESVSENKALREELEALKQSIPKIRADAIRDFADYMQDYEVDPHGFNERAVKLADDYANKIEAE
jgi:hypothetical protein